MIAANNQRADLLLPSCRAVRLGWVGQTHVCLQIGCIQDKTSTLQLVAKLTSTVQLMGMSATIQIRRNMPCRKCVEPDRASSKLVSHLVVFQHSEREPGTIAFEPDNLPVTRFLDQTHLTPRSPPTIDFSRERCPNISPFYQNLQIGQQFFIDISSPSLDQIVGMGDEAYQPVSPGE